MDVDSIRGPERQPMPRALEEKVSMRQLSAALSAARAGFDAALVIRGMANTATVLAATAVVVLASFVAVALGLS
jgi:hypothetical protein